MAVDREPRRAWPGWIRSPFWQGAFSFLEGTVQSGFFYVNNYSLIQRSVRSNLTGRASGLFVTS
jgi:hypothetical protein